MGHGTFLRETAPGPLPPGSGRLSPQKSGRFLFRRGDVSEHGHETLAQVCLSSRAGLGEFFKTSTPIGDARERVGALELALVVSFEDRERNLTLLLREIRIESETDEGPELPPEKKGTVGGGERNPTEGQVTSRDRGSRRNRSEGERVAESRLAGRVLIRPISASRKHSGGVP